MEKLLSLAPIFAGILPALLPRGRAFLIGLLVFIAAQPMFYWYVSNEAIKHGAGAGFFLWPVTTLIPTFCLIPALAVRAVVVWALNGLDKYEEPINKSE